MRSPFAVLVALIVVFAQLPARASDFKWWATSAPYKATNGQITLPNASGTSRTIQTNPTGANVSTRTANTQAPTVVVQATASMPIKAAGDPCVASNSSDNLYANENHAITADRTSLLTCQSGAWTRPGAETSGQYAFFASASCPAGWVAANGANGTVDLRGEFIRGWDAGRGADPGRGLNTWQADEFRSHTHPFTGTTTSSFQNGAGSYNGSQQSGGRTTNAAGGAETRPRNVALLACMKQ